MHYSSFKFIRNSRSEHLAVFLPNGGFQMAFTNRHDRLFLKPPDEGKYRATAWYKLKMTGIYYNFSSFIQSLKQFIKKIILLRSRYRGGILSLNWVRRTNIILTIEHILSSALPTELSGHQKSISANCYTLPSLLINIFMDN